MIKKIKKMVSVIVMTAVLLPICSICVKASEGTITQNEINAIVQQFSKAYSDALVQQDVDELQQILVENESNAFFTTFMQWRFAIMQNMDSAYNAHTCDVVETDIKSNNAGIAIIHITFNEDFEYADDGKEGYAYNTQADLQITDTSEGCKVTEIIFTNEEDFYGSFCDKINAMSNQTMIRSGGDINLSDKLATLILELEALKEEMDAVTENQVSNISNDSNVTTLSSSYNYIGYRGAQYAQAYGSSPNANFYSASSDCTNFVSQCVWAAYGGWSYGMSNSTMVSNISNKVRMVSNVWHGGSGGGMPNWESVESFWSYVTSNQGNGPKARGYNNGGWYTDVLPIDISQGDVLQKSNNGSSYFHSVYVVSTPGGSDPTYNLIYVAQHSGNYSNRKLSELIGVGGSYIRQIKFQAGTFNS